MKLTSEQKTRLVALLVTVAASTALSDSETAEMHFLTGIAQNSGEFSAVIAEASKAMAQTPPTGEKAGGTPPPATGEQAGGTQTPPTGEQAGGTQPPTTREKLGAAIAGKPADTMAANRVLTAENGRLKAELSQVNATLAASKERIATLEAANQALASKDKSVRDKEVESHVRDELASVGQPEKELASNSSQGLSHEENLEAIRSQIAASNDPREKGRLALAAKKLRETASLN